MTNLAIRQARAEDHEWIVKVVDDWWSRPVAASVPRLFLEHFHSTSLVAEQNGEAVGFLIGFLSPSQDGVAYIHFAGVNPTQRSQSIGRRLYERFYELASEHGGSEIQAITSASNHGSIAFHRQLGFAVGDPIDGYDRPGVAHVQFIRSISPSSCRKRR